MLAAERHNAILAELASRPAVRIAGLAERLNVSEMTIRRDIETLDAAGMLHKVHGGATRQASLSALEPGFRTNTDRQSAAKKAIAGTAATLITPGMTIAITGGTTTFQLVEELPALGPLTVLTNSLPAADRIHAHQVSGLGRNITVLLTGGERSPSEALVGPLATGVVRGLNVDVCFMGAHGVDLAAGITTPNLAEADTNRAFARQCARLVVLADFTKFGVVSLASIAPLSDVDCIVTDKDPGMPDFAQHTRVRTPEQEPRR